MGFTVLIDIIGSMIVGGMLFVIVLNLNDASVENTHAYGGELMAQKNLVEVVRLLEHDFRKIGYCAQWDKIPDPSKSILFADSNSISFLTDVNSDGNVDTLRYFTGPVSQLSMTDNPRDRMLYRIVNNGAPIGANLGVTQFYIKYFNVFEQEISFPIVVPSEIYTMQIDITVENTMAYNKKYTDDDYSTVFWRQIRLAARNLKNR